MKRSPRNSGFQTLFLALGLAGVSVGAPVPGILNHQGKVTVNGTNYTGVGQFKFALVNAGGQTTYWSNDGAGSNGSEPSLAVSLPVTRGVFSVNLGDGSLSNMTAIPAGAFTNSAVYLRTWFNDGANGWQQFSPDRRVAAAAYALVAGSVAAGGYPETDPRFSTSAAAGIQATDLTTWNLKVGGSGTGGYVPKFTAPNAVGNSGLFSDGAGNLGLGTTSPAYKLDVSGDLNITGQFRVNGVPFAGSSQWVTGGSGISYTSGNVGVGTASSSYRLDVNGNLRSSGQLYFGSNGNALHQNTTGLFGQAVGMDFGQPGVFLECNSESGGFFANGDHAAIWSAGDTGSIVYFLDEDGMSGGSITTSSALKARIDVGGAYFQVSDARDKENIRKLGSGLNRIKAITGYTYTFKQSPRRQASLGTARPQIGFIAQELQQAVPEAVEEKGGRHMVNYAALVPVLVEALKEQQAGIETISAENRNLKAQHEALLRRLEALEARLSQ